MAQQILKINAPSTSTQAITGTSAIDDYITIDRTLGATSFSPLVILSDFSTNISNQLSLNIFDIVNNKIQTITLPSLKDTNSIENIEVIGNTTPLFNGKYKIVASGDYSLASDSYLDIYATATNDSTIGQSSLTSVASIWGGVGDDNLTGAGGGTAIYGGVGNNILHGRGSQYDYFRAFTADKSTGTIIEDSKTGSHFVQIYLPSAFIKSWSFKHVANDLVGSVTDANGSAYNFTIKDQYLNNTVQSVFFYSEGVAGSNGNAFYLGGDFTDAFNSPTTWAFIAGTSNSDTFDLSTTARVGSRVFANEGNDIVVAKNSSELKFYAGSGVDTVIYSNTASNYTITLTSSTAKNILPAGRTSADLLENVERIKFSDKSIAYDVSATQPAGLTVQILNAAFGKSALANKAFVGIGLSLFDSNISLSDVAALAVSTGLVSAKDNTSFVKAVWQNVVGSAIDQGSLDAYVGMLNNGTFTQASLLAAAATTDLNKTAINLVGLAQTGIDYMPTA